MPTNALIDTLNRLLGADGLLAPGEAGARYHVDFGGENACAPAAVLRPRTTGELAKILQACSAADQPVVAQGGMTGLCGTVAVIEACDLPISYKASASASFGA
jgi:FAD/FMN-containing dehydrogenase